MKTKRNNLLFGLFATALLVVGCTENNNSSKNSSSSSGDATVSTNSASTGGTSTGGVNGEDTYTFHDYTTVSPSNWNELTYQDGNDTQIMSYIGSSFFTYDFEFDANGEIVPGGFDVEYSAATNLEDVTSTYAGDYGVPAGATSAYAYKITLRDDLKWDDGTPIAAADFVYSMKEQLNPDFLHYRADSYYAASTVIHNAENYVKQGQETTSAVASVMRNEGHATIDDYLAANGSKSCYVNWNYSFGAKYDPATGEWGAAEDKVVNSGLTVSEMWTLFQDVIINQWGYDLATAYEYFTKEVTVDYSYPELDFSEVGIFVGDNQYEIVVVLDLPLDLLDENGDLTFKAAYNFSGLPLVKQDLFEDTKQEPVTGSTLWTSTYNSSLETTASWGPYKLTEFQAGKAYTLEKNEHWYGYGMDEYEGQYQTTKIEVETISEWNTAWLAFQKGDLSGIGIDVSISTDYKNSSRAIFTPSDYVGSFHIQSSREALEKRETENVNKTLLSYPEFRKAISLSINRAEYNQKCTTSSKAGLGLFNTMHYYDVANGGVYRDTDYAKQVLCEVYGVDPNEFATLDDAVDAITGYDLEQARELVDIAYDKAFAAGDIDADDKVVITFGGSADNESTRRSFNFFTETLKTMVEGTKLAGRLETEYENHEATWFDDFAAGAYDIVTAGWQNGAWDPGYFIGAYILPASMYSQAWDVNNHMVTYTMPESDEVDYDGENEELTMSIYDWYLALNGGHDVYNWAEGFVPTDVRLQLIARLEKEVLVQYYAIPIQNHFSASLLSYQVDYITTEYNTFMGYGGIRYMTYNYTDAEWAEYIANNELNYKI